MAEPSIEERDKLFSIALGKTALYFSYFQYAIGFLIFSAIVFVICSILFFAPYVREKIPPGFEITKLVYSKASLSHACVANIFTLKDGAKKSHDLNDLNSQKFRQHKGQLDFTDLYFSEWQKTPIILEPYDMSKFGVTLAFAHYCFDENTMLKFEAYRKNGNYFSSGIGGELLLYIPQKNELVYASRN